MTTSWSRISTLIVLISLVEEATVKLPRSATSPTRAENASISLELSSPVKKLRSSSGTETTLSSCSRSNWRALAMPAAISPIATAVTRSRKTVSASVITITSRCSRCTRNRRVRKRQSMMSQPTFTRMPARTAWGISSARGPRPSTSANRIAARSTPETGVLPPARRFTTVPGVAPAPASPPKSPAATLPIPCPTSSRFGLCCVRVIESAISEVSRLSMDPSSASVIAGCAALARKPGSNVGRPKSGRPLGTGPMSPITSVSFSQRTPSAVPTTSAARVGGK